MLEPIRAWLNGKRDYYTGVALFEQLEPNSSLINLFSKGPTDFTIRRLQEELLKIYKALKSELNELSAANAKPTSTAAKREEKDKSSPGVNKDQGTATTGNQISKVETAVNEALYSASKLAADKQYKETMNNRAVLFSLADTGDLSDPNRPDLVEGRAKLALAVVQGFQLSSQLYDNAEYVKEHGRLPDEKDSDEENEYDHLADSLVKQTLDNLRKNYNKIKKREQTPTRVALLQKHEKNIEKLLKRWHSLNSVKNI